jgi:phosphatidylglycerol---prolipoprotein diacylglyceryl transferase
MLQEVFRIPGLDWPIYGFGLMMVLGLLAAMGLAKVLARRSGLDPEFFVNAALLALVSGILGARISHVLENLAQYTRSDRSVIENMMAAINLGDGGLTYYGGFLLAFPTLVVYAIWKRMPVRPGMDIVAPCLMLALGFGRVGCFLNGCCYGGACELPWAVTFPYHSHAYVDGFYAGRVNPPEQLIVYDDDGRRSLLTPQEVRQIASQHDTPQLVTLANTERSHPVHPAQLYSAITALLLAGVLLAFFTLPHAPGNVFSLMMMLEGSARFVLELLRAEPAVLGPFSISMLLSLILVGAGLILWLIFRTLGPSPTPNLAAISAPTA